MLLGWLMLTTLYGLDSGEKVKIRGLITGRAGDTLVVKTTDSTVTVVLTDERKVQKPMSLGICKTRTKYCYEPIRDSGCFEALL